MKFLKAENVTIKHNSKSPDRTFRAVLFESPVVDLTSGFQTGGNKGAIFMDNFQNFGALPNRRGEEVS